MFLLFLVFFRCSFLYVLVRAVWVFFYWFGGRCWVSGFLCFHFGLVSCLLCGDFLVGCCIFCFVSAFVFFPLCLVFLVFVFCFDGVLVVLFVFVL